MKVITILSLLLLVFPVFAELTKEDVRTIIKEENDASEKRTREHIDLKIETVNAKIDALDQRIDDVEKNLSARIDAVDGKLSARIDAVDEKLSAKIDGLEGNVSRIWLAILALIAAAVALPQLIIVYSERKREREIQLLIQQLREKDESSPPRS